MVSRKLGLSSENIEEGFAQLSLSLAFAEIVILTVANFNFWVFMPVTRRRKIGCHTDRSNAPQSI